MDGPLLETTATGSGALKERGARRVTGLAHGTTGAPAQISNVAVLK